MGAFRHALKRYGPNCEPSKPIATDTGSPKQNGPGPGALLPVVLDDRLRRVLHMIESRPPHSIQDMALELNLSVSRLQHLFKQRTGLGLGQLLAERRMQQANDFLVHTNMSIKEIASSLGYEHASSFTRAFEHYFRQSPSRYRQAHSAYGMSTKVSSPIEDQSTLSSRSPQK